jgi:hypothetical protein
MLVLSRHGVPQGHYLVTRNTDWEDAPDPWSERHKLPLLKGGILGEIIYGNEPRVINDLVVPEDDPAYEYLAGMGHLIACPQYQDRQSMTVQVLLRKPGELFDADLMPDFVWTANLFGIAVHNSRLGEELQHAYKIIDEEMRVISELQRALLPPTVAGRTRAGVSGALRDRASGGRRLLRLVSFGRQPARGVDGRRERTRRARGRFDGDHAQHRADVSRVARGPGAVSELFERPARRTLHRSVARVCHRLLRRVRPERSRVDIWLGGTPASNDQTVRRVRGAVARHFSQLAFGRGDAMRNMRSASANCRRRITSCCTQTD